MKCNSCGAANETGARFCGNCGSVLDIKSASSTGKGTACPRCQAVNPPASRFCENCGATIGLTDSSPKPQAGTAAAETKVQSTSAAWWLLPIFLTWVGGLIAWVVVRDRDRKKANRLLVTGILMAIFWIIVSVGLTVLSYLISPDYF
ncbi:MAG: zinc-ribbon domain-containing protein [Dehalococcoidaceae bacterium]|nr:zinc-ribbon domain-containing protein [Dehalococcoidaceae bacterium]